MESIASTSKTPDFLTSHMDHLLKIRDEITQNCGAETALAYIDLVLKWLQEDIDQDGFDKKGQELIPDHLHSEFFAVISEIFKIDLEKQRKFSKAAVLQKRKLAQDGKFEAKKFEEDPKIAQKRKKEQIPLGLDMAPQNLVLMSHYRSNLLHPDIIHAKASLYAWKNGLDRIDEEASALVYQEIRTMLSGLFESTLRVTRPHLVTDYGFLHSFGQRKMNLNLPDHVSKQTKSQGLIRAIFPSKEPITAQDILDTIEIDDGDIKLPPDLKRSLISRLETLPEPPRKIPVQNSKIVQKVPESGESLKLSQNIKKESPEPSTETTT